MEEKNQQRNNKKKLLLILVPVLALALVIGVTYAFFNYTRTGVTNSLSVGKIYFNMTYGDTFNLSNAFPISSEEASEANNPNVGTLTVLIEGNTTYEGGIEYLITAEDVNMKTNLNTEVPVVIEVGVENNEVGGVTRTLGQVEENDYYTARTGYKQSGSSKYKLEYDGHLDNHDRILVGYIAAGETGINGSLVFKAYIDGREMAITDTPEESSPWQGSRTVISTSEWNSLNLTFKIKAEANEGIWVPNPGSAPMTLEEAEDTPMIPTGDRTIQLTAGGDGELSCQSSNTSVATCEIEEVTPVASPTNNEDISPKVSYLELTEEDIKPSDIENERSYNLIIHAHGVGTARITVTQASGSQYATPSILTYDVEVAKLSTTMSLSSNSGNVNIGSDVTATITTSGDGVLSCVSSSANASCNIDGSTLTIHGVSEGNATITVSQGAGTTHLAPTDVTYEVSVSKNVSTLTLTNNSVNLTYGTGGENGYTYNGDGALSCTSGDETKVTCSIDTNNHKIILNPVAVTTGTVTVTVSGVEGTNYYAPTSRSFTVTVAAKVLTANTPICNNKIYDGSNSASCTISYNNIESGDSVAGTATCAFADVNAGTNKTVICNTFTKTGTGNENYTVPTGNVMSTANIAKASSSCPTTSNYSGTYDASSHTINVTANASGGTAYYRIDNENWDTTNPSKTNAGTYTVDVKVVGDSNHNDNTSCPSGTITISRKATTMSISPSSGTVEEGSSTTTTITTDGDGTKSCQSSNESIATCSVSGNTVTINGVAAGSTTITVKQAQGTNYNAATDATYSVTVNAPFRGNATQLAANAATYGLETTDYGKIYAGSDPDNYVWFNNEQWRILGVYDGKFKIIKAESLSQERVYNDIMSGNAWSGSNLEKYLNQTTTGGYYNGLSSTAKSMIVAGTWNVGATSYNANANTAYSNAQATVVTNKNVGLIASYEYLYAAGESCRTVAGNYDSFITCGSHDWLKPNNSNECMWLLNPILNDSLGGLKAYRGYVITEDIDVATYVYPVVYLNSSISITGGNGKIGETNSYKLS